MEPLNPTEAKRWMAEVSAKETERAATHMLAKSIFLYEELLNEEPCPEVEAIIENLKQSYKELTGDEYSKSTPV